MSNEQIENTIKEAGSLRICLKAGKLNLNKLADFLARVENIASPGTRERRTKQRYRNQLARLNENLN